MPWCYEKLSWVYRCHTFAVLKVMVLQSGRMLIDFWGNLYELLWKRTSTSCLPSLFTRKAAHCPEFPWKTYAWIFRVEWSRNNLLKCFSKEIKHKLPISRKENVLSFLTCCSGPKEKVLCAPWSSSFEHDFIAACNSFRWPHFGCLIKPAPIIKTDQIVIWKIQINVMEKSTRLTILVKRGLVIVTCYCKCRGCSSKIGSSMIL